MATALMKQTTVPPTPTAAHGPSETVAIGDAPIVWAESPARLLHDRLVSTFVTPPPVDEHVLTARVKLAILFGAGALAWAPVVLAVRALA